MISAWLLMGLFSLQEAIPAVELQLTHRTNVAEVELGQPFELEVIQVWDKNFEVEDWGPESLEPLTANLLRQSQRENATHREETRVYRCLSFQVGAIELPAFFLRASSKEDGSQRVALADELAIRISSSLPDEDQGIMEMPRDIYPAPFPWALTFAVGALIGGFAFAGWRVSRNKSESESLVPRLPPAQVAVTRLQALKDHVPENQIEERAFFVEASSILCTYLVERFRLEAPGKTTEELFSDRETRAAIPKTVCDSIQALLAKGDLVKYGGMSSAAEERGELLDSMVNLIETTREDVEGESLQEPQAMNSGSRLE